jgi:Cu-Zn family superoxide dismutase
VTGRARSVDSGTRREREELDMVNAERHNFVQARSRGKDPGRSAERWCLLIAIALTTVACAGERRIVAASSAQAVLRDATGEEVGTATFTEEAGAVRLSADVQGLPPGEKGVHIHQTGACEPPTFESAGAHFNPEGRRHGTLNPEGPHAGDLPNLEVAQDGRGRLEATTDRVTLSAGTASLVDEDGSALVVHAQRDDLQTDPSGNSGDRIACGVIERT